MRLQETLGLYIPEEATAGQPDDEPMAEASDGEGDASALEAIAAGAASQPTAEQARCQRCGTCHVAHACFGTLDLAVLNKA